LLAAGDQVATVADELAGFGIAATIQHDDLHGGNVFSGPAGIRFFDWGDAVVAHPFGSMLATLHSSHIGSARRRTTRASIALGTPTSRPGRRPAACCPTRCPPACHPARAYRQSGRLARALDGLGPSEMEGHGDAPALWLTDFAELLDAGVDR
jgi:hypothetical protein